MGTLRLEFLDQARPLFLCLLGFRLLLLDLLLSETDLDFGLFSLSPCCSETGFSFGKLAQVSACRRVIFSV